MNIELRVAAGAGQHSQEEGVWKGGVTHEVSPLETSPAPPPAGSRGGLRRPSREGLGEQEAGGVGSKAEEEEGYRGDFFRGMGN